MFFLVFVFALGFGLGFPFLIPQYGIVIPCIYVFMSCGYSVYISC